MSYTPPSLILATLAFFGAPAFAQISHRAPTVVTESIRGDQTVTLARNTHPLASRANDRGAAVDSFQVNHMYLQLKRSPEAQQALELYLEELHNPASPNFHQWLTAKQFGERFGIAQDDLDTVTGWLQAQGFRVHAVYPNLAIDFSGTAREIRSAFHAGIHRLAANGKMHHGNIEDPQIPAALSPLVAGVASLNDFMPAALGHAIPAYTVSSTTQTVVPADLATIYNANPAFASGLSGQGQTIAVLEDSNLYGAGDWSVFRKVFGLARPYPSGSLTTVHPSSDSGSCADPGVNSNGAEAILDAEWATAAAPSAAVVVASCADTFTFGALIALQNILTGTTPPPPLISISYGVSEVDLGAGGNAFISSLYQLAVAQGVSVFVAAGDSGVAFADRGATAANGGISVSGYASTPYNVAVGGTDFADTYFGEAGSFWNAANSATFASARSYIPEITWNQSCASELLASSHGFATTYGATGYCNQGGAHRTVAGGGGPSTCAKGAPAFGNTPDTCSGYAKPAWQNVFGNPADQVRDLPDVSLFASNNVWGHYYVACYSDPNHGGRSCLGPPSTWNGFGGTSVSTPVMAGFQALINQKTGTRWGNPNPVYYQLASVEYANTGSAACNSTAFGDSTACTFHDITLGDIALDCTGTNSCYFGPDPGAYGVLSTSTTINQPAYRAAPGWDYATGLGSVNVWNLLKNWPAAKPSTGSNP